MKKTNYELRVERDRLRYKKNSLSSSLTYLSILLNVLYFVSIYKSNNPYYYKIVIGVSVLVNLVFLLSAFLCSEGVKNYKMPHAIGLFALAGLQIIRIFYYPLKASAEGVMNGEQLTFVLFCLIGSAVTALIAGVFGVIRTKELNEHMAYLESEGGACDFDKLELESASGEEIIVATEQVVASTEVETNQVETENNSQNEVDNSTQDSQKEEQ